MGSLDGSNGPDARAIAYLWPRDSSDTDAHADATLQRDQVEGALRARGWPARIMQEAPLPWGTTDRPVFTEARRLLSDGTANVLVVARLDCAAVTVQDLADLILSSQRQRWHLIALDVHLDTAEPAGGVGADLIVALSHWPDRQHRERTRHGMQRQRQQGVRLGRPVELAPEARSRVAELRADGLSLNAIARQLNAEGVPTARGAQWHPSSVRSTLRSLALDAELDTLKQRAHGTQPEA